MIPIMNMLAVGGIVIAMLDMGANGVQNANAAPVCLVVAMICACGSWMVGGL